MAHEDSVRLLIHGAQGRMGTRIVALAREDARFNVVAAHDKDDHDKTDRLETGSIDAIIDFTSDQGAQHAAQLALKHRAALLVGTTGLTRPTLEILQNAAKTVAVMIAPNTSLGVAVLSYLAREAAKLLGPEFDVDLIESHHTKKRDAPSGTALRLLESLERGGVIIPPQRVHVIRAGDIIGEHRIEFAGPGERLTLMHSVTSRDLFARGALRAAHWLKGKPAGLYTIEQSLGLAAMPDDRPATP